MSTIATTIRIQGSLQERYDQLARATGRTRNYLMAEALERYVAREGWQIEQTRASLEPVNDFVHLRYGQKNIPQ